MQYPISSGESLARFSQSLKSKLNTKPTDELVVQSTLQSKPIGSGATSIGPSTKFLNDLEKHLDEYERGKPAYTRYVPGRIRGMLSSTSFDLSALDPKASQDYRGYLTALPYEQRSRYVHGNSSLGSTLEALQKVEARLDRIA